MTQSILIVEDDLTFATMLKTWLGKKGYEVETASTNARARKLLTTRDFPSFYQTCAFLTKMEFICYPG